MKLMLVPLTLSFLLASCRPPDGCAAESTRCSGNVAEICDADEYYQELIDCEQVSRQSGQAFVCSYVDEEMEYGRVQGHTCVPRDEVVVPEQVGGAAAGGAGGSGGAVQ